MTTDEHIGLSRIWMRAAAPTPRTTFSSAGVALMTGRPLPAWPHRSVAVRRLVSGSALDALAARVRTAEGLHAGWTGPAEQRLPCGAPDRNYDPLHPLAAGPSWRAPGGLSERLVAALTAAAPEADLIGYMVLSRRMFGRLYTLSDGAALLVDLDVDVDWQHVLPAMRGLGYGHALGAAIATTITADVRRITADLAGAPLPTSIRVSVSGTSRSVAVDAIVRGAVATARLGLEPPEAGTGSSIFDRRLTDGEFAYLLPDTQAADGDETMALADGR